MANVTKSGKGLGAGAAAESAPLSPADQERLLVRRAQQGDSTAYEELLRTHQHRVLAVVGGILRGSEDVEDVGQDASRRVEHRQLVGRLLDHLEDRDRLMLVMKEVEGFSVEEISKILGLNINTVKVRLFRARGRLVEVYQKRLQKRPLRPSGTK